MLGRNCKRLAKPKLERAVIPCVCGASLAFIGGQNERLSRSADKGRDASVCGRQFAAGVDHENDEIGLGNGLFRLFRHPGRDAAGFGVLQPGCVGQNDVVGAKADACLLAVARQAGHVIDERQPLASEPVEYGRFADIGPADDGDGVSHGR